MKRSGFTLIEMLVVTAILGLLLALTIPTVGGVLERGKAIRCMANLRAMGQAVTLYTANNQGRFPLALSNEDGVQQGWDFFIQSDGTIEPGWIWRDYGVNEILQCPSYQGPDNWMGEPHTGYNYNASYLGGMRLVSRGRVMRDTPSASVHHLPNPSRTAVIGDGEFSGGANKFMRAPRPGPLDPDFYGRHGGTQGFRHRGRTHVVFADGNVQALANPSIPPGLAENVADGTGFLSTDNSFYGGE